MPFPVAGGRYHGLCCPVTSGGRGADAERFGGSVGEWLLDREVGARSRLGSLRIIKGLELKVCQANKADLLGVVACC